MSCECSIHLLHSLLCWLHPASFKSYIYRLSHRIIVAEYPSLSSPLRHTSTASSSEGSRSAGSRTSSYLSQGSSAPTSIGHADLLSESPEALNSFKQHIHHSALEFATPSGAVLPNVVSTGSTPMSRPHPRRQTSYADLGLSHSSSTSLPPVHPDAFAPIQLGSAEAQELDDEPPLTLPQPWAIERQRSQSSFGILRRPSLSLQHTGGLGASTSSYLSNSLNSADRLTSSHHDTSFGAATLPTLPAQLPRPSLSSGIASSFHGLSAIPPDMPKNKFVEGLVGAACIAVEVVWKVPDSKGGFITHHRSPDGSPASVLPLRHFIKEVLRRSRSTCSTLQTALYYIHKSRDMIRERVRSAEEAKQELIRIRASGQVDASTWNGATLPSPPYGKHDLLKNGATDISPTNLHIAALLAQVRDPVLCGRRMFLAALICASKFLQDRTYSNRAWAKISSLPVAEVNANEKSFLQILDYNLFVDADLFRNWTRRLQDLADKQDRKQVLSTSPVGVGLAGVPAVSLQQRAVLAAQREGIERSSSEYLPAPEQHQVTAKPPLHSSVSMSSSPLPSQQQHILPRPTLSQAGRFATSMSFPTLQLANADHSLRKFASGLSGGSCSDFARSTRGNLAGDDWATGNGGDNMVA